MIEISISRTPERFIVKIDGLVHFLIEGKVVGFQSWIEAGNQETFMIEYYLEGSVLPPCKYDRRDKWEKLLKQLELTFIKQQD